jgi:cell division protein ZapA
MPELSVTINGRNYAIACEEGQEEHIGRLAGYVKVRVEELVESNGQIGDARLLLMASLLVSDELSDAYADLAALQAGETDTGKPDGGPDANRTADKLERLAERAEAIAARLEAS